MKNFEDFLEEDVNPPTEQQRIWATENFSSRVLPELEKPEECVLGSLVEDEDVVLRGMVVSVIFTGHSLVDVPFED